MPELPEIETVKMQLQKVLVGQRVVSVSVRERKIFPGDEKVLIGKKVLGIERKGKVLLIDFGSDIKLGFHFKMTGQLIYVPHPNPSPNLGEGNFSSVLSGRIVGGHPTEDFVAKMPSSHTRVVFHMEGGTLYFNDQRLFGWVMINPKFVDKLGPEPITMTSDEVDRVIKLIQKSRRPIKVVIMDQEIISGVGNIYANDACWEAGIHPDTGCAKLSDEQLHRLFESVKKVLLEGIKYGGATAADAKYINLHGLGGHYQEHFRVYDREGLPCLRPACRQAGVKIKRVTLGGRGTFYCPACQK
jgi:formamidopyrimidine-DNA glycosylase